MNVIYLLTYNITSQAVVPVEMMTRAQQTARLYFETAWASKKGRRVIGDGQDLGIWDRDLKPW